MYGTVLGQTVFISPIIGTYQLDKQAFGTPRTFFGTHSKICLILWDYLCSGGRLPDQTVIGCYSPGFSNGLLTILNLVNRHCFYMKHRHGEKPLV